MTRRCLAEAIGTFALVFAGTGAIIIDDLSGGAITHFGVAACFGLVVMTMIYAVGDVSGAHLNPAVTLGFWWARRMPGAEVGPYVASQLAGAINASLLLRIVFPEHESLGATVPIAGVGAALVFEVVMTFLLVFVILGVATGAKEKGMLAGVAVGGTVGLCALFGGPVSGASMNPARSLGPALVAGELGSFWIYLIAPAAGAILAVFGCRSVRDPGCCAAPPTRPRNADGIRSAASDGSRASVS